MMRDPRIAARSLLAARASRKDVRAAQERQLSELLRRTAATNDRYACLWQTAGIAPGRLPGVEDLWTLPTVRKGDLRGAWDPQTPGMRTSSTSGTSGEPFIILHDPASATYLDAVWIRSHMAYGLRPWHTTAYFRTQPAKVTLTERLGLFRAHYLDIHGAADAILEGLRSTRPDCIGGYPSHLADVVNRLPAEQLRALGVRWVTCGAETLDAGLRREISEAFGATVVNLYGSAEFGCLAVECRVGRLHVNEDSVLIEVLDGDHLVAPGEMGELVVTGLWSAAAPLIRYRTGDYGAISAAPCPCGSPFATLEQLRGRGGASVVTPDGKHHTGAWLCRGLRDLPHLRRYQIIQEAADHVLVKVITAPGFEEQTRLAAQSAVADELGDGMTVTAAIVRDIPPTPGGKMLDIVELVS